MNTAKPEILQPVELKEGCGLGIMGPDGTYWPFPLSIRDQKRWAAICHQSRSLPKREDVIEEAINVAGNVGRQFCSDDGYVMGGPAAIVATIVGALRALKKQG